MILIQTLALATPASRPHTAAAMTDHASRKLRQSLGQFATGVTVITCTADDGHPCGITANSFSSVSLEPPLVLWNIAKVSHSLQAYLDAPYFAIHILDSEQKHLAEHFAKTDHKSYEHIEHCISDRNVPILPDVLARFDCRTHDIHDGGDHHIIIGEVVHHEYRPGSPLLFFSGGYAAIG